MNATVHSPAFAHKLPPKGPTLLQLALAAIHAKKSARQHLHSLEPATAVTETHQCMLDDLALDTAEEFFAALEAQTGIDRAVFGNLSEIG